MTPAQETTARKGVRAPRWRWLAGMCVSWLERGQRWVGWLSTTDDGERLGVPDGEGGWLYVDEMHDPLPVLEGEAGASTRGCLLHLVREALGDPGLVVVADADGWAVLRSDNDCDPVAEGATEAEALVAALEAAS